MIVDAAAHPGPALWQGIMMIAIAVWAIWIFTGNPSDRSVGISLGVLAVIAAGSLYWIAS